MLTHHNKAKQIDISNAKMAFSFSYEKGLMLNSVLHKPSGREWLCGSVAPFEVSILGTQLSADCFTVEDVQLMKDDARVSVLAQPGESLTFLVQMGAKWPENCPEEVFLHIPLFSHFGQTNNDWYLSSCPVRRPDGSSVMQLHDSFDLPLCNIAADQQNGFSMELRDTNLFAEAWNQLRNCDLLHMTQEEQLLKNRILLRLQNEPLTDVMELRFFALENGWREAFSGWKERIREQMDLSEYARPDLEWYRKVLYQHFTFAYSKEVFNYDDEVFEPERLIRDGEEFGGYDSVLLWYQYPRLGVDERTQWDFNRDIPGGLAGMRDFTRRCKALGVRVFLPYKPWDIRSFEDSQSIAEHITEVVRETEIDGIWFDTMDQVPEGFRERIDTIRPGVLFCTEVHPAFIKSVETITGHWDQFFDTVTMPHSYLLRYLFPENNAPITSRWKVGESKDMLIHRAIFNGTGFAIWQDIFNAWLPFSAEQRAALKKWKQMLLAHFDTFFGQNAIPMVPVMQKGLYANSFTSDDGAETIYTLYNASDLPIEGELLRVQEGGAVQELWRGAAIAKRGQTLCGRVEPMEVLVIRLS